MSLWTESVAALSRQAHFTEVLDAAVKSTLLLTAAGLCALFLRRRSAASRHAVWALALGGLLALPLLSRVSPGWHWPLAADAEAIPLAAAQSLPVESGLAELRPSPAGPAATSAGGTDSDLPAVPLPDRREPAPHAPAAASQLWLLWVWSAGALFAAVPLVAAFVSLWWLRRGCRPAGDGPAARLLAELAGEIGLRRRVALLLANRRPIPMTWGVFRPVILLPAEAASWSPERLRVVLRHELVHVRRWDCLTQVAGQLARALYWFHPLAWLAVRELRREQERACDDAVLNAGAGAADYAEHLLAITAHFGPRRSVAAIALAVGRASRLEHRLVAILDPARDRRPPRRAASALAATAALAVLVPLAGLTLAPRSQAEQPAAAPGGDPTPATHEADQDAQAKLARVREAVRKNYVRPVEEKTLEEGAIRGMLQALNDPHTEYLDAEKLAEMNRSLQGGVSGIGAQLRTKGQQVVVFTPLDDSPALKAGVRAGDVILAVDGQPTKAHLAAVIRRILGKPGTQVKLKVLHADGKEEELTITRAHIRLLSAVGFRRGKDGHWDYILDPANRVGYLRIVQFGPGTPAEVQSVVERLKKDGLKGLILDLRGCPGGILKSTIEVAELLLAQGTIVTVKGHDRSEHVYRADGGRSLGDFPVAVLIDETTSSGGEVLAAALQDNGRAVLLGTRTFGKGTVQQLVNLDGDAGALKLTAAYFYRPNGRNINKSPGDKQWGADPDEGYYVPLTAKQAEEMERNRQERQVIGGRTDGAGQALTPEQIAKDLADPQLAAALRTMTAKVTKGEFVKVGKPNAALNAALGQREKAQQTREQLLKKLEQVNKELADLDKAIGEEKK